MNKYQECISRIAKNCKTTNWSYSDWDMEDDLEELEVLVDDYSRLEKALDKACEELCANKIIHDKPGKDLFEPIKQWTKEQWKEWLLKDEQ